MKKTAIVFIAASALAQTAFAATSIPIPNASFELAYVQDNSLVGVGNWSQAANFAGLYGGPLGGLTPTHGSLMLCVNGPDAGGQGVIYQRLNILQPGTYNFQVDVGYRNDLGGSSTYDVAFYAVNPVTQANDYTLARQIQTVPAPGTWETKNFSFTITGSETWLATDVLQIAFTTSTGIQVAYDNLRGDFTAVPETSSCILGLSGIALLMRRRRINR